MKLTAERTVWSPLAHSFRHLSLLAIGALALAALLAPTAAQAAGPPVVSSTSFSEVSETAAAFKALVNPKGREVDDAHFQYIAQPAYEADGNSFGAGTQSTPAQTIPNGEAPVAIEATATELAAGTTYRLRVFAHNKLGTVEGPEEAVFRTLAPTPLFGSCPNDPFRTGQYAPLGHPSATLPDCRAYEQASPVDKNGNDLTGTVFSAKASRMGERVSFQANSPLPGGSGAQTFKPTYLASRGEGGWSTRGLLPPQASGENARVTGWTPDLSRSFAWGRNVGEPNLTTLLEQSNVDGALATVVPFSAGFTEPLTPGSSDDGSVVFFEFAGTPLAAGGAPGRNNLYAWDRESGTVRLAGAMNTQAQTEALLAKGTIAGEGNPEPVHATYARARRAISADGRSVYFTAGGSGQLYRRLNPTEPQSALDGEGNCTEADKACTIHVSATERTPSDPAGAAPAAFAATSTDGQIAYFTSPEKLTQDANTGPEQPPAQIGRLVPGEAEAEEVKEDFLAAHALGMAVDPSGEHIYWANPAEHSIGRAKLNPVTGEPEQEEPEYIVPGETEFETHPDNEPGVLHSAPAAPRYVAVDSEHVYWTNTGPLGGENALHRNLEDPVNGAGTIGRATIDPITEEPHEVKPEWIPGAFNPQGLAVNASHVYWANAASSAKEGEAAIGRATIGGGGVQQQFVGLGANETPYGMVLDADHVYFSYNDENNDGGYVFRLPLEGGAGESGFIGKAGIRSLALQGSDLYWASKGETAIGRIAVGEWGSCGAIASCEKEFFTPEGPPVGLAADSNHLYFSVNGETPPNPGNDLYRYTATPDAEGHHLADLTADSGEEDGAEVRGVLGSSADGEYVYFVANAVLSATPNAAGESAAPGTCHGSEVESESGACNLYLAHGGQVEFIARLAVGGEGGDQEDWRTRNRLGGGRLVEATARLAPDGRTLLFRSSKKLTPYDNHGTPEYYLYRAGAGIACVSCNPSGEAPSARADLGDILTAGAGTNPPAPTISRNLSASGQRAFFETTEALVGADTDGAGGCPVIGEGTAPVCQDVYEWEAPGTGSCTEASPFYSPVDRGCIYLLSPGEDAEPSYFLDADEEGQNAFFMTRARLVGQDADTLLDVYDARVGGGLASQAPQVPPLPCDSAEACKPAAAPAPSLASPTTPGFQGPGNAHRPNPGRRCPKGKRTVRRHGKPRCVQKHGKKRHPRADRHHGRTQ